jgi:O-antigen/teichoic acid export membrane protein
LILVVRFAAAAVLNYAFGVALAWVLVPGSFGIVSGVQNVLLLSAGAFGAGMPWALAARIADTHGKPGAAAPHFRTALVGNVVFGAVLGTAFFVAQVAGADIVRSNSYVLALIVAVEMPLMALNTVLAGAAQGSRRFGGLGTMQAGEIFIKCIAGLCFVVVFHLGPAGVCLGFVAGSVGSVMIGLKTDRDLLPGRGPSARLDFLRSSGATWLALASVMFLITADVLGLGLVGRAFGVTTAAIALYQACGILARAVYYVTDALVDAVFPYLVGARTKEEAHGWFMTAVRWVPLVVIPVQLGFIAAPGPLLRIFFPPSYAGAQTLLRVLAFGSLAALLANMLVKTMIGIGQGPSAGRRMPFAAAAEVVGLIVLVPRYGAVGAAWAFCLGSGVAVALVGPVYMRAQGVRLLRARTAVLYLGALVPTAVILLVADRVAELGALVLIAIALAVFCLPARMVGVLTASHVAWLRDARRRVGRQLSSSTVPRHLVVVAPPPTPRTGATTGMVGGWTGKQYKPRHLQGPATVRPDGPLPDLGTA